MLPRRSGTPAARLMGGGGTRSVPCRDQISELMALPGGLWLVGRPAPTILCHVADLRDIELRNAALEHVRELQRRYDDLVPVRPSAKASSFAAAA